MNKSIHYMMAVGIAMLSAGALAQESVIENQLGMTFLYVKPGTFLMGAPASLHDVPTNEKPQHKVTITKPFYMAKYEVTQAQWEAVMGSNPYDLPRSNPFYHIPGMKERITHPSHPATISWEDAQAFIKRLNQQEHTTKYRLPTEAEWEYVARAGTTSTYFFGEDEEKLSDFAWHSENFMSGGTHPIGLKKTNPWGFYDIYGNVWEWVQDYYADDYYQQSSEIDPKGPVTGGGHVVRGGSWHITSSGWRSTIRKEYATDYRGISIGLRLVKEVE